MVADLCYARLGHTGGLQIAFGPAVLAVEEVEHAAHGFGPGVHPARSVDGVAFSYALLFQPGGMERLQLGLAEGVVLDDGLTGDACYGEKEGHDDAGAIFSAVTVDNDGTFCHA